MSLSEVSQGHWLPKGHFLIISKTREIETPGLRQSKNDLEVENLATLLHWKKGWENWKFSNIWLCFLEQAWRSLCSQTCISRTWDLLSTKDCSFKGRNDKTVYCPRGWIRSDMISSHVTFVQSVAENFLAQSSPPEPSCKLIFSVNPYNLSL